jgi:hypothetical protein
LHNGGANVVFRLFEWLALGRPKPKPGAGEHDLARLCFSGARRPEWILG